MQVYETPIMSSEMHGLISSGIESLSFSSRNIFLGSSEGEMSSRSEVMTTSYQGLGNTNAWKSLNVQESRSNTAWAAPSIVIPSNIQGLASYSVQNMPNSLLVAGGGGGGGASSSLEPSEASPTASMMDIHSTNGLAFDNQRSFVEGPFNIPSLIHTVSSEVSPSVRESTQTQTHSQWQSSGSDRNLQQQNQFVMSHLNNTVNWGDRRSGSQPWSSREPFLHNISSGQDGSGQGLSLSLSFRRPSEMNLQDIESHANVLQMDGDIKAKPEGLFGGTTAGLPYSISSSYSRDGTTAGKGNMNPLQNHPLMMHVNGGSMQGTFSGHASGFKNSVHLRAAQELLYEFCNVGVGDIKSNSSSKRKPSSNFGLSYGTRNGDFAAKSEVGVNQELYGGDRFELQRRKAKLVSMLEEVDRRYKHYRSQMQAIISSFECVTSPGGAAPYTALALKAMSRHFRCLRDVICKQLQMTSKSLGENETVVPGTTRGETPRLGFLERSIRQQRALQQLGMMEQHPWRPQRGLPERSVSLLRAWLFEHFLHPYPTDADKHLLARQTGLTRSQVSNWFINARVRLWKPMVEEMYLEEAKEEKMDSAAKNGQNSGEKERGERSTATNNSEENKSGGGSDSQFTASEEEEAAAVASLKIQDPSSSTAAQTAQAESFDTMKLHQIHSSQDDMKSLDMALIRESQTLSAINASQGGMKFDLATSYKKLEDHKGLYTNKSQETHDTEMTLDFSSYNITTPNTMAAYSHEDLNPRSFANGGVSLTLGLHHSGGLSFPMTDEKYDNNMYFPREDACSNQYNMLENEGNQGNGFIERDLQYRNYVNGNRLLHDFVG
ncbi:hypothetical protein SUGI_0046110 [Cryptomeria japonica]|uniref:BEL1-like homeodomain protein 4 n=1 Tax=Cryptomeria japonica TaxID=3369 RepID=UPI002408D2C4|nr:BEL1-like homeodomain protein 4 [Cryptomeria japonica]GLJ06717.1 hypothetical protein SUGI_0046110 [Cryptomeria japonica]